jgi:hypothetical protein
VAASGQNTGYAALMPPEAVAARCEEALIENLDAPFYDFTGTME